MYKIRKMRRLPLEGTNNTRDLGGYPCEGGITRWNTFLRSDSPAAMTAQDIEKLAAYGIKNAVDLRGEEERKRRPSPLETADGFSAHHVTMSDRMHETDFEGDLPGSMSGLYISMLDNNAPAITQVFRIFAAAEGGTLFHCAIGKDRTGVIAMLLLQLARVSDEDTIADYSVTDVYIKSLFEEKFVKERHIPDYVIRSRPESMERVLKHLHEVYGDAENYLLKAGVSAEDVFKVKSKIIEAQ